MARQLASLLKGGVPLFQALTIIANQLEGEREKEIVGYLRDEVKGGAPLSEALKAYPEIFDNLFVYSVAAGEKTGALDSILKYQADLLESRANVKGEDQGSPGISRYHVRRGNRRSPLPYRLRGPHGHQDL